MKKFNNWLAQKITDLVSTMWCMVYFSYVCKELSKVLGQYREDRNLLDMAWPSNKTRVWSWFLGNQKSEGTTSPQENIYATNRSNTRKFSNRPSLPESFVRQSETSTTGNTLCQQCNKGQKPLARSNSLQAWTRIYFREHLSTQRWKQLSRLSYLSQYGCKAVS